jgi:hypothetical protein
VAGLCEAGEFRNGGFQPPPLKRGIGILPVMSSVAEVCDLGPSAAKRRQLITRRRKPLEKKSPHCPLALYPGRGLG